MIVDRRIVFCKGFNKNLRRKRQCRAIVSAVDGMADSIRLVAGEEQDAVRIGRGWHSPDVAYEKPGSRKDNVVRARPLLGAAAILARSASGVGDAYDIAAVNQIQVYRIGHRQ